MTTSPVFKNLGKFIELDEKKIGKGIKVVIRYTQPNYQDPSKVWEHGQWEDKISEELLGKLSDLTPGQEYCVQTVKNEAGYPDLYDVSPASDVPPKATGGAYQKKFSGGANWQPKDDTGIAVGAAWTNAIQLYGTIPETDTRVTDEYLAQVADIAWRILQHKLAQEAKLRASKAKDTPKTVAEEAKREEKPMSKLEQMKAKKAEPKKEEEELSEDSKLDDIEF